MASPIEEYRKKIGGTKNTTPSIIEQYRAQNSSNTRQPSAIDLYRQQSGGSRSVGSKDLRKLNKLVEKSGLEKQAERATKNDSGETNEYMSGGLITDFFDVLNTSSYGASGAIKDIAAGRKVNTKENIKQRESFADKDSLGKHGIVGVIAGTALDIVVDPLTWVAPLTVLKKIPGATKLAKVAKEATFGKIVTKEIADGTGRTISKIEGGTTVGKWAADKFAYMFGRDPVYREMWERMEKNIGVSATGVKQMTKAMLKLPEDKFNKLLQLGDDFRLERKSIPELKKFLSDTEIKSVQESFEYVDDLGKQMVDLGLLDNATYQANKGKYIKSFYEKYAEKEMGKFGYNPLKISKQYARQDAFGVTYQPSRFGKSITKKFASQEERDLFTRGLVSKDFVSQGGKILKKFEPLSEKQIKELGQISNPAYIFAKTAMGMLKDIENAKFFNEIGGRFGSDVAQDGFTKIVNRPQLGILNNKHVPDSIAKDLTFLQDVPSDFMKGLQKATSEYKFFKVVMNPASNIRNIISNKLLNNFDEAGMPLYRLDLDYSGLKSFLTKDEWFKEVESMGGAVDTFRANEIGDLIEISGVGKLGGKYNQFKEFMGNIYQGEEMMAKMSMYKFQRINKKLSPEEAWKIAERATFNYSQVTPFVRQLRSNLFGFPFLTFSVKSTPVIAKTILKNPTKISNIGKIKNSIEQLADIKETEEERAMEPSWVRNGFYIKLPMKDKFDRSAYFDLTYILPFGDLAMLGDETNLNIFNKSPALGVIRDIGRNRDYFGNQIWKKTDPIQQQTADIMRYLTKAVLPPPIADQIPGGYNPKDGKRVDFGKIYSSTEAGKDNQRRTLMQEMARMAGMKIQPIAKDVQEGMNEWNKKKAIQELLKEQGVQKSTEIFYENKDK